MPCNVLIKPLINMFCGEYAAIEFRKKMIGAAADPTRSRDIKNVILDALELYRTINEPALYMIDG